MRAEECMLGTSVSAGSSVSSQESLTCPEAPRQGDSIIVDLSAIAKAPPCREDSGQELLCLGKDLIVFICLFVCALVDPVCLCVVLQGAVDVGGQQEVGSLRSPCGSQGSNPDCKLSAYTSRCFQKEQQLPCYLLHVPCLSNSLSHLAGPFSFLLSSLPLTLRKQCLL